jgi:hypothetical protein
MKGGTETAFITYALGAVVIFIATLFYSETSRITPREEQPPY